ncbi:MAG: glycoside hydrolase family 127 protein, partial [Actinomycetota bacterium]
MFEHISPGNRLHAIPPSAVAMAAGSFWWDRIEAGRAAIPALFARIEEQGGVDNFRRLAGTTAERRGLWFTDSDLFKVMEAAAWALQSRDDPALRKQLGDISAAVVAAQNQDGYLNTYITGERYKDLDWSHELYCAGHFLEAAVAHHRATGEQTLLDAAKRLADHLSGEFGPGRREQTDGHPEIELALANLYRATGEPRYLDLARFFLSRVDHGSLPRLTGHAVRALYYSCGLTDLVAEGDDGIRETLDRFWTSLTESGSYITGGIGGRWAGESIGRPYELPNEGAYAETCGSAAAVMWSWRMLALDGDARFTDFGERALLNGFLAGVSHAGDEWFYVNRLAWWGEDEVDPWGLGMQQFMTDMITSARRKPWYDVTCCPSNAVRLLASLPSRIYGASPDGIWVHLYAASTLRWRTPAGRPLTLTQHTDYPWDLSTEIQLDLEAPEEFSLHVRIPGWSSSSTSVYVNGDEVGDVAAGAYLEIRRTWSSRDEVSVELDTRPLYAEANPRLTENRGSVAITRGPLVYCLEGVDNPGVDVFGVTVDPAEGLMWSHRKDLLGGVTVVSGRGTVPS